MTTTTRKSRLRLAALLAALIAAGALVPLAYHRNATGPDVMRIASSSITAISSYDDGANSVRPGTLVSSARSNSPWWLAPSSPWFSGAEFSRRDRGLGSI